MGIRFDSTLNSFETALDRVAHHIDALRPSTRAEYRAAIRDILGTVSRPDLDAVRVIARHIPRAGVDVRQLKSFVRYSDRLADRLALSTNLKDAIRREVGPRIDLLERFRAVMKKLEFHRLARPKRDPVASKAVRELAALFIEKAGDSKRRAYRRTAEFLKDWDPERHANLTAEQVRLRCERPPRANA